MDNKQQLLTNKERQAICRSYQRWLEVQVRDISRTRGADFRLVLSCGHVTLRRRRVRVGATVLCEQCAVDVR